MRFLVPLLFWAAGAACAGEYAVLASGSRLHIDRHETSGARVKLFVGGGTIEMPAGEVRSFEAEEVTPAQAPKKPVALPVLPAAESTGGTNRPPALRSPLELADAAAEKYGLPHQLVRSVMKAESGFQPQAISPKGAVGLMQLMPSTAETLGADPHDPAQNADAGARYLRDLLEKYNGGLWHALAAYNAGPGAVQKYGGVPPYPETLNYIRRIEKDRQKSD